MRLIARALGHLDRGLHWAVAGASILVLPLSVLLFVQWSQQQLDRNADEVPPFGSKPFDAPRH